MFLSYTLEELGSYTMWEIDLSGTEDFQGQVVMEDDRYTACSSQDQIVTLSSEIDMEIYRNPQAFSLITMDESTQDSSISWDWKSKKCGGGDNHFNRPFLSYYRVKNGRNIQTRLNLQGAGGTFESDAGFIGTFSEVRYSAGGKVAEGNWEGQGKKGSFRFEIRDLSSGRFEGTWSDTSGSTGTWIGSYD